MDLLEPHSKERLTAVGASGEGAVAATDERETVVQRQTVRRVEGDRLPTQARQLPLPRRVVGGGALVLNTMLRPSGIHAGKTCAPCQSR